MLSRWFNVFVAVFWLSSMSWLVFSQILPGLFLGKPPDYTAVFPASGVPDVVGWEMSWDGRKVGWATSSVRVTDNGTRIVDHLVSFRDLNLEQLLPGWLRNADQLRDIPTKISLQAKTRMEVDHRNRLRGFVMEIGLDPYHHLLRLRGTRVGSYLDLHIHSQGFVHEHRLYLDDHAFLGNALGPQGRMPGLKLGQTWSIPVLSPFHALDRPFEMLLARVEREELIVWDARAINTWVVVFRDQNGPGEGEIRGRMWVKGDGTVLRQEVMLLASRVIFLRLSDAEARQLATSLMATERAKAGEDTAVLRTNAIAPEVAEEREDVDD